MLHRTACPLLLLGILSGCQPPTEGPVGTWSLQGEGIDGGIRATAASGCGGGGVEVALHAPHLSTRGFVGAEVEADGEGAWWLRFPILTGLGEGVAELRLGDRVARLPLGARPGEHVVVLEARPGELDAEALGEAMTRSMAVVEREQADWRAGRFLLQDGERTVGELRLDGEGAAAVAVFDRTWLTEGLVVARLVSEGPELVLRFPVEPSLEGEEALIRVNVPTAQVVVPSGARPAELDRRLALAAGSLTEEARRGLVEEARQEADAAEQAWLDELGPVLAEVATRPGGGCMSTEALPADLASLLLGYEVRIVEEGGACVAEVEPVVIQHRRRARGRYSRS